MGPDGGVVCLESHGPIHGVAAEVKDLASVIEVSDQLINHCFRPILGVSRQNDALI